MAYAPGLKKTPSICAINASVKTYVCDALGIKKDNNNLCKIFWETIILSKYSLGIIHLVRTENFLKN